MTNANLLKGLLLCGTAAFATAPAMAGDFNVPGGDLKTALHAYIKQAGVPLIVSDDAVKGVRSNGVRGDLSPDEALSRILADTGFTMHRHASGAIAVVQDEQPEIVSPSQAIQLAQLAPRSASVETVTVTSSKLGGADVQSVPIAISAFSQEQLTATQTAGGPDLVKNVPNLTFTKTNFTGYNIQIRGIGTQAISVTTDPAVAVAFNDTPFIRNHFFEQEFFDVAQVEVLRGPQGTLYGRNATAGVVNLVSAKPSDQYEAMGSVDVGNYNNRRLEGMLNVPIMGDKLGIRVAGEWTKRDGYSFNETTDKAIDGRDLWSGRVTLGFHPIERSTGLSGLGAFRRKRRPHPFRQTTLQKRSWPGVALTGLDLDTTPAIANFYQRVVEPGLPADFVLFGETRFRRRTASPFRSWRRASLSSTALGGGADSGFLLNQVDPYASTDTIARSAHYAVRAFAHLPRKERHHSSSTPISTVTPELTLTSQSGLQQRRIALDGRLQPLQHRHRPVRHARRSRHASRPAASIAIRSSAAPARWSARTCRRNAPGSSVRNSGCHPISAGRSISAWVATICIIRRSKTIMSSSI